MDRYRRPRVQGTDVPSGSETVKWISTSLVAALLALALAVPVAAERELVDRVVAMVDDEAILLSEVLQEMNLLRLQRNLGNLTKEQQDQLFRTVLEDMVADQLLVARAKAQGFEVNDQELRDAVDEELRGIKQRLGGEERYREELQRQGFTEVEVRDLHRDQKRKQMLASRVIQSEVRRGIVITGAQVQEFYETHRDSLPKELVRTPDTVTLAHLLIVPQADSSRVRAARTKIEAAARRVAAGEDFAKVATETSEWPTAASGGSLGNFRYGDFESDEFDRAVADLEPGQVSPIVETRFGLQIIKLESRDGDLMSARHIVVKLEPDQNTTVAAFDRAVALRERIRRGESFEDLARRFSDDVNTRDQGGVVEGEWDRSELRPEFRGPIDSLTVGGVTSVVRSATGFHLFKLLSRTESRTATYEEIEPKLRAYVEQLEVEKRYRTYLEGLRKQFHVVLKV